MSTVLWSSSVLCVGGFFPLCLVLCIMDFIHSYMLKWKQPIDKDHAKFLVLQYGLSTSNLRELKSSSHRNFFVGFFLYIECCYFGHIVWHFCTSQLSLILSSIQPQVLMSRVVVFIVCLVTGLKLEKLKILNLVWTGRVFGDFIACFKKKSSMITCVTSLRLCKGVY